ncbi:MAG: hypothetical protein ACR2K3_10450 [Nocardioides sp.]
MSRRLNSVSCCAWQVHEARAADGAFTHHRRSGRALLRLPDLNEIPVTLVEGRQHDFWRVSGPSARRAAAPQRRARPRGRGADHVW